MTIEKLLRKHLEGQPSAKIPALPGQSGSSGVFRDDMGRNRVKQSQDAIIASEQYDPAFGPSSVRQEEEVGPVGTMNEGNPLEGQGVSQRMEDDVFMGNPIKQEREIDRRMMAEEWRQRLGGKSSTSTKLSKGMSVRRIPMRKSFGPSLIPEGAYRQSNPSKSQSPLHSKLVKMSK